MNAQTNTSLTQILEILSRKSKPIHNSLVAGSGWSVDAEEKFTIDKAVSWIH